jgi:hypothetical protein
MVSESNLESVTLTTKIDDLSGHLKSELNLLIKEKMQNIFLKMFEAVTVAIKDHLNNEMIEIIGTQRSLRKSQQSLKPALSNTSIFSAMSAASVESIALDSAVPETPKERTASVLTITKLTNIDSAPVSAVEKPSIVEPSPAVKASTQSLADPKPALTQSMPSLARATDPEGTETSEKGPAVPTKPLGSDKSLNRGPPLPSKPSPRGSMDIPPLSNPSPPVSVEETINDTNDLASAPPVSEEVTINEVGPAPAPPPISAKPSPRGSMELSFSSPRFSGGIKVMPHVVDKPADVEVQEDDSEMENLESNEPNAVTGEPEDVPDVSELPSPPLKVLEVYEIPSLKAPEVLEVPSKAPEATGIVEQPPPKELGTPSPRKDLSVVERGSGKQNSGSRSNDGSPMSSSDQKNGNISIIIAGSDPSPGNKKKGGFRKVLSHLTKSRPKAGRNNAPACVDVTTPVHGINSGNKCGFEASTDPTRCR